ncbi:MAG: hypothetical protein RBR78_00090 [Flavobacteriaceae bacterium]|jgi:hypothetical protein|nr:hypothetical protein [Flavobacteriaceae bacterium]
MKLRDRVLVFFLLSGLGICAQQGNITIDNMDIPNAPALVLLDETFTIVETPKSIKALTAGLANGLGNNVALEFSPYLLFSNNRSFYDYNGYKIVNAELKEKGLFGQIYTNLSVSVASVRKDAVSNISVGLRTNLLTIHSSKRNEAFNEAENIYNKELYNIKKDEDDWENLRNNPRFIQLTNEYNTLMDSVSSLNTKPLFSIDIAGAYSHIYTNNNYDSGTKGKIATWLTLSYNQEIHNMRSGNSTYMSFYAIGRYLNDSMYFDENINEFTDRSLFDVGGKVEIDFSRLLFGYEYIKRTNEKDNYRSVGTIKYKLNSDLILTGGFGKNFENNDNLVSFLGINWGFDLGKNTFSNDK